MTGGTVHQIRQQPHYVTKQQLADHLGRTTRWVEMRMAEGLPVAEFNDRRNRRQFDLHAVEAWLTAGRQVASTVSERVHVLEGQVASLTEQLVSLRAVVNRDRRDIAA